MAGVMDVNILTDGLLIDMSKIIKGITPAELSYYLGFRSAEGDNAEITGNVRLNPRSAYQKLLHDFVNKHGTNVKSAEKLHSIFCKNNMGPCAELIVKELAKNNIVWTPTPHGTPDICMDTASA